MARFHLTAADAHLLLEILVAEQECRRAGIQLQNLSGHQFTVAGNQRAAFDNYYSKLRTLARFMLAGRNRRLAAVESARTPSRPIEEVEHGRERNPAHI